MSGIKEGTTATRRILVTGGHGFIGSHVAKALFDSGDFVRIADINPSSAFTEPICTEAVIGNLCDLAFCQRAVQGINTVLHFAATMGGMGVIHEENDHIIYRENATMTQNILSASRDMGVCTFFYASSACVYPISLQENSQADVYLKESDAWSGDLPNPQGLYGLEKLSSEVLLLRGAPAMTVYIARFHNVYGPRGAWMNGREKAPAAMLRKAIAAQMLSEATSTLEIWGDGKQRRSFLYIDDCVDAVLLLLKSSCRTPINIGSDQSVTIDFLAEVSGRCAGLQMDNVTFDHIHGSRPVGVSARNSDNEFVKGMLHWSPRVSLNEGMRRTAVWIRHEIQDMVSGMTDQERVSVLQNLLCSQLVDLTHGYITFAVLLPITSRGSESPSHCLSALNTFAESLERTTWRDIHQIGGLPFKLKVYLAIDEGDAFLQRFDDTGMNIAKAVLLSKNISNVIVEICNQPRGHVCAIWRQCAKRAWQDGCDYFVLMGDDVVLRDEGWMRDAHNQFAEISKREGVPHGFGCVAFTDITFPGMPTFPIVHRTHMDIFTGDVIPDNFINQDGDPFLYQLYRRWNCSLMFPSRISNGIGGSRPARYVKKHADGWTFEPLDRATVTTEQWLLLRCPAAQRQLTIDVIIPSYRVQLPILDRILSLQSSSTCTVMFIIIIDDPLSPSICELEKKYAHRSDICIRINTENMGASAARNRGMKESTAEWIIFLDDDIIPDEHLLQEAESAIHKHPKAAGFIGNVHFPPADTIFKSAVHLAGVTYFWNIAEKMSGEADMPWGVTANLIARRVNDGVEYGLQFPKTGGGEDIDFVRRKRENSIAHGGEGFHAAPEILAVHPWWNGGTRSYWRFFMWSKGDGHLIKMYPDLTYLDDAPNSAELLLTSVILVTVGLVVYGFTGITVLVVPGIHLAAATFAGNIAHDVFRHLWRDRSRMAEINSTLTGLKWVLAVIESAIIRMMSEVGRLSGQLERKEFLSLGRRFEWFTYRAGNEPMNEERMNSRQRFFVAAAALVVTLAIAYK
ncbi:glycosyltransferase family 2 protein [Scleroderma yunnanense]